MDMVLTKPRDRRVRPARLRLPMRLRCDACSLHGTIFVAFKEDLTEGERHIGAIKIFRFYFKCIRCFAEIAVRTDPEAENFDYKVEAGATCELEQ